MDRRIRINVWYVLLAIWGVVLLRDLLVQVWAVEQIPYSEFKHELDAGNVNSVVITTNQIRGDMKSPEYGRPSRFVTNRVEPDLAELLAKRGVTFRREIENTFFTDIIAWLLPTLLFFGIWYFLIRKLSQREGFGGGFMTIGKSRAKVYVEEETKVTFDDVAGVDEAKEELREIVNFLRAPSDYGRLGARLPKGVLLVGPPGTGKTLLARAVAGEAGVPFFSISGSEFVEMFVGVGAARVRDLFEQALKKAPCIIFIDELDALGKARAPGLAGGGHDEKEQTLNQLLVELDGFDPKQGVILLAATNRPEILDPALLRAGRFDRQVLVDRPDKGERIQILKVHIKKVSCDDSVDLEHIASLTPGFTGADLANLVNEAALLATRRNAEKVALVDFTAAIERIIAGLEKKNKLLNPEERRVVAHHEMGHALVALSLPNTDPVVKISIIPRGIGALGYVIQRPLEDRYLMTERELWAKLAVILGGRAAEKLLFESVSTGAADDLSRATDIARSMVARYGMDPRLGLVSYESETGTFLNPQGYRTERLYSEATAREIDEAVRRIVDEAFQRAVSILMSKRAVLVGAAGVLLERETLTLKDLEEIVARFSGENVTASAA